MDLSGAQRFARFAYPPNERGFCGPDSTADTYALATDGDGDGIGRLARAFEGAYPYLELLAAADGGDPLDPRVVEAYWIGNDLLTRVSTFDLGRSIEERFRRRAGRRWNDLGDAVPSGCANHCFHVLSVSPWVGVLRAGLVEDALEIVDECRISWGTVTSVDDAALVVERTPLVWSPAGLRPGVAVPTVVRSLVPAMVGDVVAIHWGWACEVLSARQLAWLRGVTVAQLHASPATR